MKKTIAVVVFILALCFIWMQSFLSPNLSSAESDFVLKLVRPFIELIVGKNANLSFVVRKMAHYTEYALLGLIAFFYFEKNSRKTIAQFIFSLLACLFVAFIDETIQKFTGRGSTIVDVWIDFSGAFVGTLVALLC